MPQPRQLAPCRPAALCLLERGMAVLAGGGGHGLAPPSPYTYGCRSTSLFGRETGFCGLLDPFSTQAHHACHLASAFGACHG